MRLLLMEDDILLCQILKYQFEEENIKTEINYTRKEGMEKPIHKKSDIIHDCILPDIMYMMETSVIISILSETV